jgi:RNA polymerase sigma factor (sigma-70 family)
LTERELIEGCRKKIAKCQRSLFEKYAGKMMTVCRRYSCDHKEAEDMLQESFISIFFSIDQYRFEGSFEGWIRKIVVHTAIGMIQRKKVHFTGIAGDAQDAPAVDADALDQLGAEELLSLISNLPDGYRTVFNLYVVEGYDHNEIATMLEITPATSRSQLLKARLSLQTQIKEQKKIPENYE